MMMVRSRLQAARSPVASLGWMTSSQLTWATISGTRLDSAMGGYSSPGGVKDNIMSFSSGCVDQVNSRVLLVGGGHFDYAGNEIGMLDLLQTSPAFTVLRNPSASVQTGVSHYADGRPSSRHTYWNPQFISARNRMMLFGAASVWNAAGGTDFNTIDAFSIAANDWDAAGTFANGPAGMIAGGQGVCKDGSENVYIHNHNGSGDLFRWLQSTGATAQFGSGNGQVGDQYGAIACDTTRGRIVRFDSSNSCRWDTGTGARTSVTFSGAQASKAAAAASVVYVLALDLFLIFPWAENNVYQCDPSTFAVTDFAVAGTKPSAPVGDGTGAICGRFFDVPQIKVVGYIRSAANDMAYFRYGTL